MLLIWTSLRFYCFVKTIDPLIGDHLHSMMHFGDAWSCLLPEHCSYFSFILQNCKEISVQEEEGVMAQMVEITRIARVRLENPLPRNTKIHGINDLDLDQTNSPGEGVTYVVVG